MHQLASHGAAQVVMGGAAGNVMSTERLRETIHKEDTLVKRKARPGAEDDMEEDYMGEETGMRASGGAIAQQNLYDVVNRMPDVSFKYRRDDRQVARTHAQNYRHACAHLHACMHARTHTLQGLTHIPSAQGE
jgi:hypothetical protein